MADNNGSKMVVASVAGITPQEDAEQMLQAFRGPGGAEVSYETLVEIYSAIRAVSNDVAGCNECALHVLQIMDNEDLPKGVTQTMIVECAILAKGKMHIMDQLVETLLERYETMQDRPEDLPRKTAMDHFVAQGLDTPVDHGIVYADGEEAEEEPASDNEDGEVDVEVDVEDDMIEGGDDSDNA